jgi:predicted RNase H-like nuclease (RuvC/YqgF family)
MSTEEQAKSARADILQAQLLRRSLGDERRALAAKLSKHAQLMNECIAANAMRNVSHHRGRIRQLEREISSINQMVDALNRRFPASESYGR